MKDWWNSEVLGFIDEQPNDNEDAHKLVEEFYYSTLRKFQQKSRGSYGHTCARELEHEAISRGV